MLNGEDANTSDNHGKGYLAAMKVNLRRNALRLGVMFCAAALLAGNAAPGIKNMAVVAPAGSKLQDVPLAELAKETVAPAMAPEASAPGARRALRSAAPARARSPAPGLVPSCWRSAV